LLIAFGSEGTPHDGRNGITIRSREERRNIEWEGAKIPIYGQLATFENQPIPFLSTGGDSVSHYPALSGCGFLRVGYDLFDEVRFLLRKGQPVDRAQVPTLDIHIDMLRNWILERGIPFVEIPPSPYGYDFITCLTHDIDFMGIRDHKFDHTMLFPDHPSTKLREDWIKPRGKGFKNLQAVFPATRQAGSSRISGTLTSTRKSRRSCVDLFFIPSRAGRKPGGKRQDTGRRYDAGRIESNPIHRTRPRVAYGIDMAIREGTGQVAVIGG
jgi:hypothetical protein